MNRTDRLMAIVLELQNRRCVRAEDLAARFETSVRTVYRDMQALSEAGVPVAAVPGLGYSLMEGYFLPPVTFRAEEAATLLLGSEAVLRLLGEAYREAGLSARMKLEAVLPAEVREQVESMRKGLRFWSLPQRSDEKLDRLYRAVLEERAVCFRYTGEARRQREGAVSGPGELREVEPYGLVHAQGVWHLVGHCLLRGERRLFRLDRMAELEETERAFRRPADFDLHAYTPSDERPVRIRVRLVGDAALRYARNTPYFYVTRAEEDPEMEGGLLLTLQVRYELEALPWLLGWGAEAEVLELASLRGRMAAEAEKLHKLYGTPVELLT
ncbi:MULTISPECIES: helix-turn-helix transcriptional regulator [Paenibacillus]|uniref:helix-turn-helix transcriptional regulator n=1 Tax=Paenibacillus TaxID=44249 RepID=UPI0022B8829B|nr:YafY family protein [Paenibacillus caseinilyticus]MCZ8519667.1 YafY family protein [Paenibacillus caseinilyticus]